ncbi:MAG TPA: MBL fold metallo-hydrolase [Pseudomonadales bacterium]|nr:MBL fold metallo-hydrolase [Pseudomonadales bacterium]
MKLCSLGSGSRGNGTLVRHGDFCILVDCGFTLRQLEHRLAAAGLVPADLGAVLVTHEHSDHCTGIAALARRTGVPVHATAGTWRGMKRAPGPQDGVLQADRPLVLGDVRVHPVTVPHDAREPVQFRIEAGGLGIGVLTDLGHPTRHVIERFSGCDGLLLEFNHDPGMLRASSYPEPLKRRVGGDFGHLANAQSAQLLQALEPDGLQVLIAGHLSEQNNTHEHARAALEPLLDGLSAHCHIAVQDEFSGWFEVAG